MTALLSAKNVSRSFGGLKALTDCNLEVEKGSITGLIGPNGSGKTTLFNVITGYVKPDAGSVTFEGDDITGFAPDKVFARAKEEGAEAVVVSAKIESEIAVLPADEQKDYLEAVGLAEPGLNRVIRAGYDLLHLITYFTVGPKEARAWTIEKGTKGPAAAGVIHTDFEKGYIRAETIAYPDYVSCKGEAGAREAGKFRLEGKEYVVQDGDVMHFRFAN